MGCVLAAKSPKRGRDGKRNKQTHTKRAKSKAMEQKRLELGQRRGRRSRATKFFKKVGTISKKRKKSEPWTEKWRKSGRLA